ncbi:MAG TPA: hypothetical protein VJ578_03160 [Dehalococcoidia bacterium]|nr:hypothetical protein [Dehalococcoidia bacterium]
MERKESKGTIMTKGNGRRPFEYEYRPGDELVLRFRRPVLDLIPCEARDHLLTAQKEFLLALRSLVDAAISRMEEHDRGETFRRTEIKVE